MTTLTSVMTLVAMMLTVRLLARGLGPQAFGSYSQARRILSTIEPVSTLMMAVAMTRYAAMARDGKARDQYFLAGLALCVVAGFFVVALAFFFREPLTVSLFTDYAYLHLFLATLFMTIGYSFYTGLYSLYRGKEQMGRANLWQLAVIAVGPLVVVGVVGDSASAERIVFLMGLLLFAALFPLAGHVRASVLRSGLPSSGRFRVLLKYSVPRVPSGGAFSALFAVGPFLAPYYATLADVGFLVVGQSLLRLVEGGVEGFARVVLPRASSLVATGDDADLGKLVAHATAVVVQFGLYATLHIWLWAPQLIAAWIGPLYADAVAVVRMLILATVPYLAFVTLRSIIDAIEEKAANATNLYISLGVALAMSVGLGLKGFGVVGLAAGSTAGFAVLGTLTVATVRRFYPFPIRPLLLREALLGNIALLATAVLVRERLLTLSSDIGILAGAIALESLLLAIYCVGLWKLGAAWMLELHTRILADEVAE